MTKVKNNKWLFILLFMSMLITEGCSSSNSTKLIENPYEKQDISGVWVGFIGSAFAIGIITTDDNENFSGRFIGQYTKSLVYTQFVSPDGFYLTQTPETAIFSGDLEECTWNTNGPDYSTLPLQSLTILGSATTKSVFGGPLFSSCTYTNQPDNPEQPQVSVLVFYYNTTYDVLPNVNNLSGDWEINDILKKGNNVIMSIAPNTTDTTQTSISGQDGRGNTFNGTIKIHYNPNPLDKKPHNVYDVNVSLKETNNTIDLTGLATYVLAESTGGEGITIPKKTLAIGVTDKDKSHSLSGLAKSVQ